MDTLIKTVAWLTDHALHQRQGEPAATPAAEDAARAWFDPQHLLGLDRLDYRRAWDALP